MKDFKREKSTDGGARTYGRAVLGGVAAVSLAFGGAASALATGVSGTAATDAEMAVGAAAAGAAGENFSAAGISTAGFSTLVKADAAEGAFAWDQATRTPNQVIAGTFRGATVALCNATIGLTQTNPLEWRIAVSGDVANAFVATVDELAAQESVNQDMTCTCGSNPADGRAIISADVKGIPVTYLIEQACPVAGANTVTFICSDGTEAAFPLGYVIGRHAVLSYEVNGEDLSASVGGNNQLWMTATPASYFVRDVVEVRITKEDVAPANPGEGLDYPNSPNVGMLSASVA